jgi:hypothetical protein
MFLQNGGNGIKKRQNLALLLYARVKKILIYIYVCAFVLNNYRSPRHATG